METESEENRRLKNTVLLQKTEIKELQSKLQEMEATVTQLENTIEEKLEDLVDKKVNQRLTQTVNKLHGSSECNLLTLSGGQTTLSTISQDSENKTKTVFAMSSCKYCILEENTLYNAFKIFPNGSQDELKLAKCYNYNHQRNLKSFKKQFELQPDFNMVAELVFKHFGSSIKTLKVSVGIGKTSRSRSEWYHSIIHLLTMMPNLEEFYFEDQVYGVYDETTDYCTNAKYQSIPNGTENPVLLNLQKFIIHVDVHKPPSDDTTDAMRKASISFVQKLEAPNLKSLMIKYNGSQDRQNSTVPRIYKLVTHFQASLHALELQDIELVNLDKFPALPCLKTLKVQLKFDTMTENLNQVAAMLLPLQDLEHLEILQDHLFSNVGMRESKPIKKIGVRKKHVEKIKINEKDDLSEEEMIGGNYKCARGCEYENVHNNDKARFKKIERELIQELWKVLPKLKSVVIITLHFAVTKTKFQAKRPKNNSTSRVYDLSQGFDYFDSLIDYHFTDDEMTTDDEDDNDKP